MSHPTKANLDIKISFPFLPRSNISHRKIGVITLSETIAARQPHVADRRGRGCWVLHQFKMYIFGKERLSKTCMGNISDSCEMSWSLRILRYSELLLLLSLELLKEASQTSNFSLSLVNASLLWFNKPPAVSRLSPALEFCLFNKSHVPLGQNVVTLFRSALLPLTSRLNLSRSCLIRNTQSLNL